MPIENAVSGPDKGNAGDGFAAAFDAAIKTVDMSGAEFSPDAMDPVEPETQPVETETDEPAATPPSKAKPDVKAEKAPTPPVAAPADDIKAPAHWDAAKREAFAALPPEARKLSLELAKGFEADYTRKSTELAEDRKFSQYVRSLINDGHRSQIERAGLTIEQGIAQLIGLNDEFTKSPKTYARRVFQFAKLDPRDVFPEYFAGDGSQVQGEPPAPGQPDPYSQLYGYLQTVHGELEGIKREKEQATLRTVNRSIDRFAKEQDAEGQPKRPHFEAVQGKMAQLLTTPDYIAIEDYGERLQAAYDAAVYLDPNIKNQIVDSEVQKRLKAERDKDDLAKARKAKAPVNAAPAASAKNKPGNLQDAISQSMNMLGVS